MQWQTFVAGLVGAGGLVGATLYAHVQPIPALGQAAYIALFHAPVLLWLSRERQSLLKTLLSVGFLLGVSLFTGSIYLRYLGGVERATIVAPTGGTLLILSWLGISGLALRSR